MAWFQLLGCQELRRVARELAWEVLVRVSGMSMLEVELELLLVFPMEMNRVDVVDPCLYYGKVGTLRYGVRWSLRAKHATVLAGELCA